MKLLNMIKIRTRLTFLVLMMAIGIVAVGWIGFYYNNKSSAALEDIYAHNIMAIEKLSDTRTQSRANFANVLNLMVAAGEEEIQTILADFKDRAGKIDKDLQDYNQQERDEYEIGQCALIDENLKKWNDTSQQIIDMISAGKTEEAAAKFSESGKPIFEELQTSIRDLLNYNIEEADTTYKQNSENNQRVSRILIIVIVGVCLLAAFLSIVIVVSIVFPMKKLVKLVDQTADLNLSYDKSYEYLLTYKDELGAIANAMANLRRVLRSMVSNLSMISGNLAASSEELAASTEESTKTINQVVNSVNEIAIGNNAQAEMVGKTSETVMSMAVSIDEVNHSSDVSSENAQHSLEVVEVGHQAINVAMTKMKEIINVSDKVEESNELLSNQMDKVVSIIDVIGAISEQTNLLALNASIEAARAGEAGRGFAVVATEISKLSKDTAKAVNEITEIITLAVEGNKTSVEHAETARRSVEEQQRAIQSTKDAFDKIRRAVEDIAQSSVAISERMTKIDEAAREVSNQTQDMSAVAEESAASSQEISATNEEQLASIEMIASAANDLSAMATELNNEITKFRL